tara:strand:+ start:497 stop:733 length:237 start_codon:yes stop_codon:yes gene_type:complete
VVDAHSGNRIIMLALLIVGKLEEALLAQTVLEGGALGVLVVDEHAEEFELGVMARKKGNVCPHGVPRLKEGVESSECT